MKSYSRIDAMLIDLRTRVDLNELTSGMPIYVGTTKSPGAAHDLRRQISSYVPSADVRKLDPVDPETIRKTEGLIILDTEADGHHLYTVIG